MDKTALYFDCFYFLRLYSKLRQFCANVCEERVRSVQHFRGVKYLQHTFRGNITLMTHMKVFEHMW